ncbi:ABC transporter substrate-binding protein [Deinococcus yavapaiensis]|uniref:Carbohydrate ABC transporter substrate-binding protein (CUT1 family) n=1 Tax=Deinococcus yavapaiensis KR-236 TaxID=694435 RepID=A0A318S3R7_9DEIO|nr:sugar ABC transporter substrate-binding protein [Deinococcus yavapaiensis]PYE52700.1 carbohydrate ABC transporter substrate-binding protein (CUT1 family) [Deinococcus yavapaiensis KR-236]
MKKLLTLALLTASTAFAQSTVTYYSFTTDATHMDDMKALISAFEAQNPGVKVNLVTAPFDSYFTKLQTDIAAGNPPDAFELNYENFATFASRGALRPLAASAVPRDTFYPAALNAFRFQSRQYGLPITFSTVVLFYNKDLFDKAGVKYPTASWKWKDVLSAAQKINNPAQRIWGVYQPVQFWEFYKVAQQAGGGLKISGNDVQIDTPQNRAALKYLVDKVLVQKVMPTDAQMSGVANEDLFLNGQLGMLVSGIWMFDKFSKANFKWDIAVEPGGTKKGTHFFSNAAVVSAKAKNADAATKWVQFLAASPTTAARRIASSWELPALSLSQRTLVAPYLAKPMPANREAVFDSLRYAVTPPVVENQSQLQDIINQELEAARLGTKTVEQALASAQARVEAMMRK